MKWETGNDAWCVYDKLFKHVYVICETKKEAKDWLEREQLVSSIVVRRLKWFVRSK